MSPWARGIDTVYQAEGGEPLETANDLRRRPRAVGGIIGRTIAGPLSHVLHHAARSGVKHRRRLLVGLRAGLGLGLVE